MINCISLGAGVQSSTMALMAKHREISPMPDCAIFADTQSEPESIYKWLDFLENELPFPIYRITAGDLLSDFLKALESPNGRCGQPPFFVKSDNGEVGILRRKCTTEYKINPIRKKVRELYGRKHVNQWIGISIDEAHRMKPSGRKNITNCWPLIDKRMNRGDCLSWMKKHQYPTPPKSACLFCPYTDKKRLSTIRENKNDWDRLVYFDYKIREIQSNVINGANINGGKLFVNRSCVPIAEIDFNSIDNQSTLNLFGNECEGMCGV